MAGTKSNGAVFASAGLILLNATASYELMAPGHSLTPIRKRKDNLGTWKFALREAYIDAYFIDYEAIFFYAVRILDTFSPGLVIEQKLEKIYETAEYIVSKAGLLKHDLAGRIYHSALGRDLAKAYATYYTSIPASELLGWLGIENWDDKVADFACGSGTLLLAAYHKKLSIAFFDPVNKNATVEDLHKKFVEEDLFGFDAMPFAAHLTLVNLALQQPSTIFRDSQIHHVPVGQGIRMGSIDLLKENKIVIQKRLSGGYISGTKKTMDLSKKKVEMEIPEETFDLIIMNPPFTKKQRVSEVLDKKELKKTLKSIGEGYTTQGGLPLPFILLGNKYIRSGGRIALVIPSSILDRSTWSAIRELLITDYDLEHIIVSWIEGNPSFSEDTDLREILFVVRKKGEENKKGKFTLITHIDEDFSFIEARQIAEQLILAYKNPLNITIKSPTHQPIHCGVKLIGEAVSFPKPLVERTSDNWYRLLAFRKPKLVRSSLIQQNIISDPNPPYNIDFSAYLTPISNVGDVGLFIKQVGSAGFVKLDKKPKGAGIKSLMTSDYNQLKLKEDKCHWLVKDHTLKAKEKFNPGIGHLLAPRKMNLYSTAKVLSVVSDEPVGGNMWIPIEPNLQITKDKKELDVYKISKICGLWLQSSFGILLLLSLRHEIEGAWSEWVTEDIRNFPVLNPKKIDSSAVKEIMDLWLKVENIEWDSLVDQFKDAINDNNHPRRIIDKTFIKILVTGMSPDLNSLYSDLCQEIEKLGKIM